jgi:hypothetical protein
MSITYNTATLNARLTQVINNIDAGPGSGVLRLGTSGMALILSSITLAKPSGTVAGGVLTFSGTPLADPSAANSGSLANARIEDSTGVVVASGLTIGTSSAFDIVMTSTTVIAGQSISLTSATITGH